MLAAISPLTAAVVGGPARRARVLGVFPTALYLGVGGVSGAAEVVVPVVTCDALLLPTAVRLPAPAAGVRWGLSVGDVLNVGNGRIDVLGTSGVSVVRQWRPARVSRRTGDLRYAGWSPAASAAFVAARVGCGQGLTPDGDDELCGALLVAHALTTGRNPLRDNVLGVSCRTTSLSASLLRAAGDGYAVPELAAYVDAVLGPRPVAAAAPLGHKSPKVARLEAAVAAIGHSSGAALLRGVALGLAVARPTASTPEPACA